MDFSCFCIVRFNYQGIINCSDQKIDRHNGDENENENEKKMKRKRKEKEKKKFLYTYIYLLSIVFIFKVMPCTSKYNIR